ncbi:uncharacterized protein LOC141913269 [Tubulanus polymorphus]|uniref:uncharacterized protein LOC141913269 n=1 Tax=Tubulanus polymorphus TaxID=672921 RepID=UPI003DA3898C
MGPPPAPPPPPPAYNTSSSTQYLHYRTDDESTPLRKKTDTDTIHNRILGTGITILLFGIAIMAYGGYYEYQYRCFKREDFGCSLLAPLAYAIVYLITGALGIVAGKTRKPGSTIAAIIFGQFSLLATAIYIIISSFLNSEGAWSDGEIVWNASFITAIVAIAVSFAIFLASIVQMAFGFKALLVTSRY